jgi:hypothetical protein
MNSNQKTTTIVSLLVIAILLVAGYFYMKKDPVMSTNPITSATSTPIATGGTPSGSLGTTPVGTDGLRGYANTTYGFSMRFPDGVQARGGDYSTFNSLPSSWRLYPELANQGSPAASFIIIRKDEGGVATGKAYPLFYDAEVRVGVSPDIAKCYALDSGYSTEKITDVVVNGITFKKFSTSNAAMMKYVDAESYRTIHNNKCYVLEQIRSGSSYRDNTMTAGLSQASLDSYYSMGSTIIHTFKFTK